MSTRIQNQKDAEFILAAAVTAVKDAPAPLTEPKEVVAAYLAGVVLAVDELQQAKNDKALVDLGNTPWDTRPGKGGQATAQVMRGINEAQGTPDQMSMAAARAVSQVGMVIGDAAGKNGKSFHTRALMTLRQSDKVKFASSIWQAFDAHGFDLTAKGHMRLAEKVRGEIDRMVQSSNPEPTAKDYIRNLGKTQEEIDELAQQRRVPVAAPTVDEIQIDLEGMTKRKPEAGNTPY